MLQSVSGLFCSIDLLILAHIRFFFNFYLFILDFLIIEILSSLEKCLFSSLALWGGRREGDSGWGTRVYLWWIHVDVWQNQYNIVK